MYVEHRTPRASFGSGNLHAMQNVRHACKAAIGGEAMQSTDANEDRWIAVRIIAYRFEGEDGWRLEETNLTLEEAGQAILNSGRALAEIREVNRGSKTLGPGEEFQPDGVGLMFVHGFGWAFDDVAGCWRGPGEALTPLPGNPVPVSDLVVGFDAPQHGWLPIRLSAGGHSVQVDASNVCDPFGDLIGWLEHLADGGFPRLTMDLEGSEAEWFVWPTEGAAVVRFAVTLAGNATVDGRRAIKLDVLIGRRLLVSSVYRPLVAFWESELFLRNFDHWNFASDEEPGTNKSPPSLRSQRLDQYLAH